MEAILATLVSNLIILGFEWWMGRSKKFASNSTIEAIAKSATKLIMKRI